MIETLHRPRTAADPEGAAATRGESRHGAVELLLYLGAGVLLGIVFVKSELISWYRIQEMFRFQSFHLYGIIGSALFVAATSLALLRRFGGRTLRGMTIAVPPKERTPRLTRYWLGGAVFGLGWALLGACPGPIFALLGAGKTVYVVPLAAAMAGTWLYGLLRNRLPH
jgi:uncharacterized membrane protein YedE/YeeE